jgi:hypothetical protein
MGKAADNERIKLRATFLNNCSVALIVGGAFIPVLSLYGRLPEMAANSHPTKSLLLSGVAAVIAIAFGSYLRVRADKVIAELSD